MSDPVIRVSATELHRQPGQVLQAARNGLTPIVTEHGEPRYALVGIADYERLQELRRELAVMSA